MNVHLLQSFALLPKPQIKPLLSETGGGCVHTQEEFSNFLRLQTFLVKKLSLGADLNNQITHGKFPALF